MGAGRRKKREQKTGEERSGRSMPGVRLIIGATRAAIAIERRPGKLLIRQPPADVSIRQVPARMRIERTPPKLSIDQSGAWAALGRLGALEAARRAAEAGREGALEGIARRAEEGRRLARIEAGTGGGRAIADIARDRAFPPPPPPPGLRFEPSAGAVRLAYDPGALRIAWERGGVEIEIRPRRPEIDYVPGEVRIVPTAAPRLRFAAVVDDRVLPPWPAPSLEMLL
ncbi:hypothetical protein SA87_08380 [Hydrogenibacillus schlegelii]|uniref:Uncharacterized protein n=3 Tax=Hydrogenibacillus schlegelii TaxID=1484 RepID=A0A179IS45_HYDSH|nr:hypothetical protein SA87_08380 [Hydrogenibacillus schlegelii]